MDIWTLLEKAATEFGRSTAVVDGDLRLTYEELHARAGRLAGFLRGRQVQRGDRISILDLNSHEYIESYFAAAALGAILNPINHRLSGGEVAQVLEDAGTSWLLVRRELAPLLSDAPLPATVKGIVWMGGPPPPSSAANPHEYEAALASVPPLVEAAAVASDDVAHLYYTSGSTGRPRGSCSPTAMSVSTRWGHRRAAPDRRRGVGALRAVVPPGRRVGDLRDHLGRRLPRHSGALRRRGRARHDRAGEGHDDRRSFRRW